MLDTCTGPGADKHMTIQQYNYATIQPSIHPNIQQSLRLNSQPAKEQFYKLNQQLMLVCILFYLLHTIKITKY
jgi:hypothetical protein